MPGVLTEPNMMLTEHLKQTPNTYKEDQIVTQTDGLKALAVKCLYVD